MVNHFLIQTRNLTDMIQALIPIYILKIERTGTGTGTLPADTYLTAAKSLCTSDLGCLGIQRTCDTPNDPNYPDSCPQEYRRWVVSNQGTTPEDRLATIGGGSPPVIYLKD